MLWPRVRRRLQSWWERIRFTAGGSYFTLVRKARPHAGTCQSMCSLPIAKPYIYSSTWVGTDERKLMDGSHCEIRKIVNGQDQMRRGMLGYVWCTCSVGIMDVRLGKTSLATSGEMSVLTPGFPDTLHEERICRPPLCRIGVLRRQRKKKDAVWPWPTWPRRDPGRSKRPVSGRRQS